MLGLANGTLNVFLATVVATLNLVVTLWMTEDELACEEKRGRWG